MKLVFLDLVVVVDFNGWNVPPLDINLFSLLYCSLDLLFFLNKMALNPAYEAIGKGFVQQYYTLFDDPAQRQNLVNMYNVSALFDFLILLEITYFLNEFVWIFTF